MVVVVVVVVAAAVGWGGVILTINVTVNQLGALLYRGGDQDLLVLKYIKIWNIIVWNILWYKLLVLIVTKL